MNLGVFNIILYWIFVTKRYSWFYCGIIKIIVRLCANKITVLLDTPKTLKIGRTKNIHNIFS